MKTAMRLGTRSVVASAKSKPHNGVKTPFNDKIVELVNAPRHGSPQA